MLGFLGALAFVFGCAAITAYPRVFWRHGPESMRRDRHTALDYSLALGRPETYPPPSWWVHDSVIIVSVDGNPDYGSFVKMVFGPLLTMVCLEQLVRQELWDAEPVPSALASETDIGERRQDRGTASRQFRSTIPSRN